MNIDYYKTLISNLPVRQQSFKTKRTTWLKAEKEVTWLTDLNNRLFNNHETLEISRQDIFDTGSTRELILKTIYWGYTGGMRGNHFVNILKHIQTLELTLNNLKAKESLNTTDFNDLAKTLKPISGLGLSTYSKLLYFLDAKFNNNPCLILDQRLIDVFNSKFYEDYLALGEINGYNKETQYLPFLDMTNKTAHAMHTKGENIEQFLFLFGNNLKFDK